METEMFELNCGVIIDDREKQEDNLWKRCVWTRNKDGASCIQKAIDDFETRKDTCDTSMDAVVVGSGNGRSRLNCSISIPSASLNDRGRWTCRLTKCKRKEDGGCAAKDPSACLGEASVYVKVFNTRLVRR